MRHRLSRGMVLFSLVLGVVLSPTRFVALAQGPDTRGLYVPPAATFIHDPAEIPIALEFRLTSLARVQSALDRARASDPNAPIVLTLTGRYTVTDALLTLPSKTSQALYGTIRADDEATASSLIAVLGQSEVAVAGGLLEGRGRELAGIRVEGSAKVNIEP